MSDAQYQTALALFGQGRHAEGVQLLGHAAHEGHVPSMSLLGGQLLTGRGAPPDPVAGIRLILAAAERGGGYACAMAGMLWASGVAGAPDWPRALDYLQRAAELGFAPAQSQLRLLSGDRLGTDWKALRRAIDIPAWRRCPPTRTLCEDPLIQAVPGLLPPALCDMMIDAARSRLGPARIYDEHSGGLVVRDSRRNSAAEFTVTDMDVALLAVRERLCAPTGLPALQADGFQVLHYKVGERFTPHFDFFEPGSAGNDLTLAQSGQRAFTILVYLNEEGLEGGETDFPRLGLSHRGAKGDALMFRNLDAQGRPDRRTLHAGLSPTAGEKWVLTQWVRDRPQAGVGNPQVVAALNGR
jgi:hypothetical protein